MNREQIVRAMESVLIVAMHGDSDCPVTVGNGSSYQHADLLAQHLAPMMVNGLLPQVSTVEELEALPGGTGFVDSNGATGHYLGHDVIYTEKFGNVHRHPAWWSEKSGRLAFPLTVVWSPS